MSKIGKIYNTACQKAHVLSTVTIVGLTASNSTSAAATNLGSVGTTIGSNAAGMAEGAGKIAAFIGLVMVIIGLIKGRSAKEQNEDIGKYVAMVAIGALMFAVPTVITIFNQTVIGADGSGVGAYT